MLAAPSEFSISYKFLLLEGGDYVFIFRSTIYLPSPSLSRSSSLKKLLVWGELPLAVVAVSELGVGLSR